MKDAVDKKYKDNNLISKNLTEQYPSTVNNTSLELEAAFQVIKQKLGYDIKSYFTNYDYIEYYSKHFRSFHKAYLDGREPNFSEYDYYKVIKKEEYETKLKEFEDNGWKIEGKKNLQNYFGYAFIEYPPEVKFQIVMRAFDNIYRKEKINEVGREVYYKDYRLYSCIYETDWEREKTIIKAEWNEAIDNIFKSAAGKISKIGLTVLNGIGTERMKIMTYNFIKKHPDIHSNIKLYEMIVNIFSGRAIYDEEEYLKGIMKLDANWENWHKKEIYCDYRLI